MLIPLAIDKVRQTSKLPHCFKCQVQNSELLACHRHDFNHFPKILIRKTSKTRLRALTRILKTAVPDRVGVIKIVIVINCNLITSSKVIACNCY